MLMLPIHGRAIERRVSPALGQFAVRTDSK